MAATWKLEFPYRRSVGPVIGAFLAGLRDRGRRRPHRGGRVLVPPLEYDPETGEAVGDEVEVGSAGSSSTRPGSPSRCATIRSTARSRGRWCGSTVPTPRCCTRSTRDRRRRRSPGTRVRIRWADETDGQITDIECFEPEASS